MRSQGLTFPSLLQDDWDNTAKLTGDTDIQIVGDDLLVTNVKRIETGIEKDACNALLLKGNSRLVL